MRVRFRIIRILMLNMELRLMKQMVCKEVRDLFSRFSWSFVELRRLNQKLSFVVRCKNF